MFQQRNIVGTIVPVDGGDLAGFHNRRKAAKVPKLTPAHFFHASVLMAIYIDDKLQLIQTIKHIISFMTPSTVMLLTPHPINRSVRDEVNLITSCRYHRANITFEFQRILDQANYYENERLKEKIEYTPTFDSAFILHNLNSIHAHKFRCMWYEEYVRWGDRDQVSGFHLLSKLLKSTNLLSTLYNASSNSSARLEFIPIIVREKKITHVRILPKEYHHDWHLLTNREPRAANMSKRFFDIKIPNWH